MPEVTIPEDLEQYREAAEKLANSMYQPHRFGDAPAWFNACVRLAQQRLYLEEQVAKSKPLSHTEWHAQWDKDK